MNELKKLAEAAIKGNREAQKKLGDIYSARISVPGAEKNEAAAIHWYRTAFINKNKEALAPLRELAEKDNETAIFTLMNIYFNGDMNGEGRDYDLAFEMLQKLAVRNNGREFSEAFTAAWRALISETPDFPSALESAQKITDNDKKAYALAFRPVRDRLFMPVTLDSYIQYTVDMEREMLRREGKKIEIISPEIKGGWGLSEEEAVIIDPSTVPAEHRQKFVVDCEKPLAAKILFRNALDLGLSNIHFELENQILRRGKENHRYDVLEFHVTGLPLSLLNNLRAHFEQAQKEKNEREAEINVYLHQTFMVIYHIKYWFRLPPKN